jgi:hypothetical protein
MPNAVRRTCKDDACDAEILLVPTERSDGKRRMPVDPEPNPYRGNVLLVDDGNGGQLARVLGRDEVQPLRRRNDVKLYVSHFFTCPGADKHRVDRPKGQMELGS